MTLQFAWYAQLKACSINAHINQHEERSLLFLFFIRFRHRLHVQGSGSCKDVSISTCQWPIAPDLPGFRVSSDNALPSQTTRRSSSITFPFAGNCSGVFYLISALHVLEPVNLLHVTISVGFAVASSKISSFLRCTSKNVFPLIVTQSQ